MNGISNIELDRIYPSHIDQTSSQPLKRAQAESRRRHIIAIRPSRAACIWFCYSATANEIASMKTIFMFHINMIFYNSPITPLLFTSASHCIRDAKLSPTDKFEPAALFALSIFSNNIESYITRAPRRLDWRATPEGMRLLVIYRGRVTRVTIDISSMRPLRAVIISK